MDWLPLAEAHASVFAGEVVMSMLSSYQGEGVSPPLPNWRWENQFLDTKQKPVSFRICPPISRTSQLEFNWEELPQMDGPVIMAPD